MRVLFLLFSVLVFSGCQKTIHNHGWVGKADDFQPFKKGQTTKAYLQKALGHPTLTSSFEPGVVYYIKAQTTQGPSFRKRELTSYEAWRVCFNSSGILTHLEVIPFSRLKKVDLLPRKTPSHNQKESWIQLLFGNLFQGKTSNKL